MIRSPDTFKQEARQINRNARINVYAFSLLFFVLVSLLRLLQFYVNRSGVVSDLQRTVALLAQSLPAADGALLTETLNTFLQRFPLLSAAPRLPSMVITFTAVMTSLLSFLFNAGYTLYLMGVRQGKAMGCGTLLDGFAFAGKIILLELWRSLVTAIWSALFVIPGIIVFYRYSFARFNLLDHPEMRVAEAMFLSKEQTKGHKLELFAMDLSFLGWDILTGLTAGVLSVYVKPYREQTWLGYYRDIVGDCGGSIPEEDE